MTRYLASFLLATMATGCGQVWNDPYPAAERGENILYSAFTQRPKHLDPVQSYSEDEATFLYQIYEPPLQYHYLKRPFQLGTATARAMPVVRQYDESGHLLPADVDPAKVARSEYEIQIQPGIRYQPHPAFATDSAGKPVYLDLGPDALAGKRNLGDFPLTGTRELTAEDYVYQIKRLAHPRLHSPVLELMGDYIIGLKDLDASVRRDCAGAVGRLGPAGHPATHSLVPLLSEPEYRTRAIAAVAIKRIGRSAIPGLLDGVCSPDADRRGKCAMLLAKIAPDDEAVAEILGEVLTDEDAELQAKADRALQLIRTPPPVDMSELNRF